MRLSAVFEPLRRNILLNEAKWCAMDLLTLTLTWGMVAMYVWSSQRGGAALLIGNVFMVYQYANQAGAVIASLASNYQNFARMRADYASADPIWNATERQAPHGGLPRDWRTIDIEGLDFSYTRSRRDTPLLHGAALTLNRGEAIALVGPSGSGKSTLMRVIAGLYDADRGRFTIDGMPHVRLRSLGGLATLIPQDPEVFESSVRDNITFGVDHPAAAISEALRISSFDSVVAAMPLGLDTLITERGLNLSGGQKQRMALARGILAARSSSLLLLDEPTSSLDPLTEARIFGDFKAAVPNACIVASVHRLNLLTRFDRIILMDDGRVVDTGTIDELIERQPLFRDLWNRSSAAGGDAEAA
jgi:ATP-binding cassette subfamily B protein